ncbi:protein EsaK [Dyella sp. M7H15-1]|uniref:protein EsaK n=1 Tax=Dyella sp. M7H15-1 TaxID=2501295 RepID=UPI0010050E50|nr:protein EsaK [Dyella sp. M7H15-1]QAU24828.1 protein EsaK [Dyella sp. M7H15-1]
MTSNPLRLDLFMLPGELPAGVRISAATLAERKACADLIAKAHDEAQRIHADAAALLEQARQDADAIRQDAHRQAAQEIEALRREAQQAGAAEAVQWLCAEQNLEQAIAREVSLRWRHLTAQVLKETIGKHDQTELLMRRIERKVGELLPHGQIALHVTPSALAAARHSFAETTSITVIADEQLTEGQARLESHLLHVHVDLSVLQHELLAQLASERQTYV